MNRQHLLYPWLVAILCLGLLARGGLHLHLCLDGDEVPVTVHAFVEPTDHLSSAAQPSHQDSHGHYGALDDAQDVEIALPADLLIKPGKTGPDLTLPVGLILLILLGLARRPAAPFYRPPPATSRSHSLRPPLRGPPLLTSH